MKTFLSLIDRYFSFATATLPHSLRMFFFKIDEVAIQGLYDSEAATESPDTLGEGIACFLAVNSEVT